MSIEFKYIDVDRKQDYLNNPPLYKAEKVFGVKAGTHTTKSTQISSLGILTNTMEFKKADDILNLKDESFLSLVVL